MALANASEYNESLSGFSDAQLFDRLFHQRGSQDSDLLSIARTLALVYSYSVASGEDGVDELATLARLTGHNRQALYAATQTLLERQLVQRRGDWRAILPPALANHLAATGLDYVPIDELRNTLEAPSSRRLLKSFGNRLGYLHLHPTAQQIVRSWLSPGGLLHAVEDLNDDRIQLLVNVAPADPEAVLCAIETRAGLTGTGGLFTGADARSQRIADLLGAMAYDGTLFERCVALLVSLATAPNLDQHYRVDIGRRLCSLFALFMSGTEATPDIREPVLRRYLGSPREDERRLGGQMLEAALKAGAEFSFALFDSGLAREPSDTNPALPKSTINGSSDSLPSPWRPLPTRTPSCPLTRAKSSPTNSMRCHSSLRHCVPLSGMRRGHFTTNAPGWKAGGRFARQCTSTAPKQTTKSSVKS